MHTLIKILGYHLGSFTSHYVGDIDKQQCRFTDWSYKDNILMKYHISLDWAFDQLGLWWNPEARLSHSCWFHVCLMKVWVDPRIKNHFLLCSCWIQSLKPHVYYNKTYKSIPFRLHNESFDSLKKWSCVLWLSYECIAVESQVKIPCSKESSRGKTKMTQK